MAATELKMNGAERSPKGNTRSTKYFPFHFMPSKCLSAGWTGMLRYAASTSNLAILAPGPNLDTILTISSTFTYCKVKSSRFIPSLTLQPLGDDKSTISLHFPGCPRLGITPKLLSCSWGNGDWLKGPANRPLRISFSRYLSITCEFWSADCLFFCADFNRQWRWKPMRKPSRKPFNTYETWAWLGCVFNSHAKQSTRRGVTSETEGRPNKAARNT